MKKITFLFMMLLISTFGFSQQTVIQDFEDGGLGEPFGSASASIVADPETGGTRGDVAVLTSNPAGNVWQGVNISFFTANKVELTSDKTMSMDVYSTTPITIAPKVINGDGAPDSTTSVSHTGSGWETLTFTFDQGLDNTTTANGVYGAFVIYYNWDTSSNNFGTQDSRVFYVDNITGNAVVDTCSNGVQDGDETDVDCGGSCAPCANPPVSAAPTPTVPASDVISLFSDAYADVTVTTWSADWDSADIEDVLVEGNATKKITFGGFLGVDFSANAFDASQMTHFHMDYWIDADFTNKVFNPKWSNHQNGNGETNAYDYNNEIDQQTPGQWLSLDIPLSDFTPVNGADRSAFAQFLITSNIGGSAYVDNIYLYSNVSLSNDSFSKAEFKSYPNPTQDVWTIKTTENIKTVQIFNVTGRLVKDMEVNASEVMINANDLANGIYLAKISNEFDQTKTIKLIKE
ncbi:T9SS type A sorting domain-containing protein [Psychroflexus sp. YR1-1]|uniref:T9SS type A sorting domain-containing protein n=1 Tax=Psychroflexus aurantiacus TaxID=2709310 RepID=A0A6B3R019_9FLAO|nr:T9SS type A sorting domain-containing protein [Psychroflexus aurantiacus]NEV92690.1 T9SS type A sorting domain-containing protein [Psychroflexus aurantiacus]